MDVEKEKALTNKSLFEEAYKSKTIAVLQSVMVATILVDYIFFDNLSQRMGGWFFLVLLVAIIFSAGPALKKIPIVSNDDASLFAYHILLGIFLLAVAPHDSVYVLVALHAIYETQFWLGVRAYFISLTFFISTFFLTYVAFTPMDEYSFYVLILKSVLIIAMSGQMAKLSVIQRHERGKLVDLSKSMHFERQRLRSLINSMGDAVIATDNNGRIVVYNGAALDLIDTNKTLENQFLSEFVPTSLKNNKKVDLIKLAKEKGGILKADDILFRNAQGETLNLAVSISSIHIIENNDEEGFICLLRDITKEKSIEEQRDDFISIVSHELRTPIAITEANISTAMVPTIAKSAKKRNEFLEQAHMNVIFLADLVNDITTISRAERGDLSPNFEQVDLNEILEKLRTDYTPKAKAKKLKLVVKKPAKQLPMIESNGHRVDEILQDLITNAIKYTDKGSITIDTEIIKGFIRINVKDTGIGISTTDQKHVFEKFYRSEDYRTRKHNGTGLGLYVAFKLAQLINAKVGVHSALEKGSTFYLELPTKQKSKS